MYQLLDVFIVYYHYVDIVLSQATCGEQFVIFQLTVCRISSIRVVILTNNFKKQLG